VVPKVRTFKGFVDLKNRFLSILRHLDAISNLGNLFSGFGKIPFVFRVFLAEHHLSQYVWGKMKVTKMKLTVQLINESLSLNFHIIDKCFLFFYLFTERCLLWPPWLLSVASIDTINSYKSMKTLIVLLCSGSYIFMMGAEIISKPESDVPLENPYMWFCWCRKILIYLVGSSICHQLATALACRPIEILYDLRCISMLIMQITGFFICLSFAFFLCVNFAPIPTVHRLSKCSNRVIIV